MDNTIDRLKSQLLRSGLQVKDQVLFQIINQLIDAVSGNITSISSSSSSGGGGSGASASASFATIDPESGLPNSRQLYPGLGVQFNDRGNRLIISGAYPLPDYESPDYDANIPLPGPQGPIGPTGPSGAAMIALGVPIPIIDEYFEEIIPVPQFNNSSLKDFLNQVSIFNYALNLVSGQIKFPATQNPSSDANVLSDYEKGTWTVDVKINGSSVGITYSSRSGLYIKIGDICVVAFSFVLTNKGASVGPLTIAGLPFGSAASGSGALDYNAGSAGMTSAPYVATGSAGDTNLYPLWMTNASARVQITDVEMTNTSAMQATVVYKVS